MLPSVKWLLCFSGGKALFQGVGGVHEVAPNISGFSCKKSVSFESGSSGGASFCTMAPVTFRWQSSFQVVGGVRDVATTYIIPASTVLLLRRNREEHALL